MIWNKIVHSEFSYDNYNQLRILPNLLISEKNNELEQIFVIQVKPANLKKKSDFVKTYLGYDLQDVEEYLFKVSHCTEIVLLSFKYECLVLVLVILELNLFSVSIGFQFNRIYAKYNFRILGYIWKPEKNEVFEVFFLHY